MATKAKALSVSNFVEKGEAPFGLDEDSFISMEEVLNKPFEIIDAKMFTNESGEGVFVHIELDGEESYLCTHATGIVAFFNKANVLAALTEKNRIGAMIIRRKSTKSDRMVYAIVDPE